MITRLLTRPFFSLSTLKRPVAALSLFGLVVSHPARADRPWQNAPAPAHVVADLHTLALLPRNLIAQGNGMLLGLDTQGTLLRIDAAGHATPFTTSGGLPPVSVITMRNSAFWAITTSNVLIQIDASGKIKKSFPLSSITTPTTHFSALQVNGGHAFIADDGNPALAMLDLTTGKGTRFLQGDISLTGHLPFVRNGKPVLDATQHERTGGNIQMLCLDARGQWLFYQTPTGPLYRIDSALLTDPNFSPVEQIDGIVEWRQTPTLGALILTAQDRFYMLDLSGGAVLSFGADRIPLRILTDSRLYNAIAATLLDATHLAVVVTEADGAHILRIALP